MATSAIRVRGLKELQRDFKKMGGDLPKDLRAALREAADPVREAAQELALTEIRNMPRTPDWADMKTGATARSVYIAPAHRRSRGSSRPNLANLLLDKAMDPALEQKADEVVDKLGDMIDRLADHNGF